MSDLQKALDEIVKRRNHQQEDETLVLNLVGAEQTKFSNGADLWRHLVYHHDLGDQLPSLDNVFDLAGLVAELNKNGIQGDLEPRLRPFCVEGCYRQAGGLVEEDERNEQRKLLGAALHIDPDSGEAIATPSSPREEEEEDDEDGDEDFAGDEMPGLPCQCLFCPKVTEGIFDHMTSVHSFDLLRRLPKRGSSSSTSSDENELVCAGDCDRAKVVNFIRKSISDLVCPGEPERKFDCLDELEAYLKSHPRLRLPASIPADDDVWLVPRINQDMLLVEVMSLEEEDQLELVEEPEESKQHAVPTLGDVMRQARQKAQEEQEDDDE